MFGGYKSRVSRPNLGNSGEASNALRGVVHRGGIRDRTPENQSFRASGLSLFTAAIVHWDKIYFDRTVRQLPAGSDGSQRTTCWLASDHSDGSTSV
jgi:TnpA family transposase